MYILDTGGTIGMKRTPTGYAPAPGYLAQQMTALPELKSDIMPDYDIHEYDPLLDSSNITPNDWSKIAQDIADNYSKYDGFIVLHGTDTMAYTASALPFILQGLQKPVIITGSQIPLCEVRNDARENLITALMIAANYPIPEVCLYFGNMLLRGCRAVKVDADGFDAFSSPNFPPLGTVGIDIEVNWNLVLPFPDTEKRLEVKGLSETRVGALRLFPGISAEIVKNILQPPLQGLVMEAYGVGNGPSNNQQFIAALAEATARGVVIVACTQCLAGTVDLGDYATGSALARAGVISGYDMTAEAALAKMFCLFSRSLPVEIIKNLMQTNMRGELTPPEDN
jgi:L-asparaginase